MDRGGEETELNGQRERVGGRVKMCRERGGGEERETGRRGSTGGGMEGSNRQGVRRDTMAEEERRAEGIKEKRTCSGMRIKKERGIEAGKERAQIKRETHRGRVLPQRLRVMGLPLLGHAAVSSSNLQKMTAEVRL